MFIPLHDQNALTAIRLQFVTLGLIGVNVFVWVLMATPQLSDASAAQAVYYSWGFVPSVVYDTIELPAELVVIPENASYVTYAFLHGGFTHLAGNMLFLWVFGDNVEDAMGHFRFLVFYLLCATAGAFAHGMVDPQSQVPLVGASGAAAGVIGAYLMLHPNVKVWVLAFGRIPLRLSALWVLGAWIAFQFFNFFADQANEVSWAAHIGGLLAGAILIVLFKRKNVSLFDANIPHADTGIPDPPALEEAEEKTSTFRWGRGE